MLATCYLSLFFILLSFHDLFDVHVPGVEDDCVDATPDLLLPLDL